MQTEPKANLQISSSTISEHQESVQEGQTERLTEVPPSLKLQREDEIGQILSDQQPSRRAPSSAACMPPPESRPQHGVSHHDRVLTTDAAPSDDILQDTEVANGRPATEEMAGPLSRQQTEEERTDTTQDEAALRNPASPGCVYSGLQLELSPGSGGQAPDDGGGVDSPFHEAAEELMDIAQAADQPEALEQEDARGKLQLDGPPIRETYGQAIQGQVGNAHEGLSTPIQTLPPASQIDPAVLDALPLQMKREIERAYGESHMSRGHKCYVSGSCLL